MNFKEVRETLKQKVIDSGVGPGEAEHAVNKCMTAMAKGGVVGGAAGVALPFLLRNAAAPVAGIGMGIVGAVAGVGYQAAESPDCEEVRAAVKHWNFDMP